MELHGAEHAFWCKEIQRYDTKCVTISELFNELAVNSQGGTIGVRVREREVHSIQFLRIPAC
jgi:hypothetical protein